MGPAEFDSLYQQRPKAIGGGVVKDEWWQYYDRLPENLTDVTLSVDLAFKDRGDFCCYQVWGCHRADRYLLDMVMKRHQFTEQLATFEALCRRWPDMRVKLVEDAANGAALISTLRGKISGIIAVRPEGSKEGRAEAVAPQIEAGNVYIPRPSHAPWVREFLNQWSAFPNGAHDDAVDCASMMLLRYRQRGGEFGAGLPRTLRKNTTPLTSTLPSLPGSRHY
jgi:predicted phage terminase large subunit-like protein